MPGGNAMVAVVENDSMVCEAIARLLRAAGFRAETFFSAESFLKRDARQNADCLVLDIHLSGMSGLELEQKLSESGSNTPIIFITADEDPETRRRASHSQCRGFLYKPVEADKLIPMVRRAIAPGAETGK